MTEPSYLTTTRESYDTVADDYAELVKSLLAKEPLGRAMLAAFAEHVRADGGQPVADLGCGPGHVTAHLNSLGVSAFGVDLSPKMVEIARRTYPDLRFEVGSMTAPGPARWPTWRHRRLVVDPPHTTGGFAGGVR